jgi:hypothetical protein
MNESSCCLDHEQVLFWGEKVAWLLGLLWFIFIVRHSKKRAEEECGAGLSTKELIEMRRNPTTQVRVVSRTKEEQE